MSEDRICGVPEVPTYLEQYNIKKLLSCLSDYNIVDSMYGLTSAVISLNPTYWNKSENWLKLNMEDTTNTSTPNAPTKDEVLKGIEFGANAINSGNNLLVHCQLGLSRSPAMAIGSLIKAGDSIESAFAKVRQVRPRIDPNALIIQIIDENLKLNGELIKANRDFRIDIRKDIRAEYNKLLEANIGNQKALKIIFENISALDDL